MLLLPKTTHPLTHLTLPLSKKKVSLRPMTIKEEKIVIMTGKEKKDRINALVQIVTNCVETPDFNVYNIPFVDFEYLFLMIRAISIDNIVSLTYDIEGTKHTVSLDLKDFKIKNDGGPKDLLVKLTDKDCIQFNHPSLETVLYMAEHPDFDIVGDLLVKCVDSIYLGDSVYDRSSPEFNPAEIYDFLENQHARIFREIVDKILTNSPYLYYNVVLNGTEIEVTDFYDFF